MSHPKIQIIRGDITTIPVNAIVNAANNSLTGGGGVDGAIHRAAGDDLLEECLTLGGCETGQAKITKGYLLPAKFVIHTVGPIYGQECGAEALLLSQCYKNSLALASLNEVETIAFPAISTGVFGYPKQKAAKIAINSVTNFLETEKGERLRNVFFVLFDQESFEIYNQELEMKGG
jgi:O-acetyl-ADP-ribose deacetylase